MKISFCTTSMNRLQFLKQTLPKNIEDNADFENLEFVLLNYNSCDDTEDWVRNNLMSHIESGRLVYYKESTAKHFLPSHSRNVSMRVAKGDIVCNIDSDNYTGIGFASYLREAFNRDHKGKIPFANHPNLFQPQGEGGHGRIALLRKDFVRLGGYREDFVGWGEEDNDLNRRLMALDTHVRVKIHWQYLKLIDHDDSLRIKHIDFSGLPSQEVVHKGVSRRYNQKMSQKTIEENNNCIANSGIPWGIATLTKNFKEEIVLRSPWMIM